MPRRTAQERRQSQQERARLRAKYRTWTDKDQAKVKKQRICTVKRVAKQYSGTNIPQSFLDDFRIQWLRKIDHRIHFTRSGFGAFTRGFVPRTIFYSLIYPKLTKRRFWMAHWGDWSLMQFNFRVVGEISKIPHIHSIFGAKMLLPCERVDLDPYNTDPTLGKISGFLCFVDPTHFKFSVCFFSCTANLCKFEDVSLG